MIEQGKVFGPYEIERELGRGGMGVVYEAIDNRLRRRCALKTLNPGKYDAEALQRFELEARAMAQVRHSGLVQIYEFGQHNGVPFIAMEYLAEGGLDGRLKQLTQVPEALCIRWLLDLATALRAVHNRGIIHRDLKPANVLFRGEQPCISDFGLVRQLDAQQQLSQTGEVLGTPAYMAPEQIDQKLGEIGPETDIYALGVIAYRLLTGNLPYNGTTAFQTMQFALVGKRPELRDVVGGAYSEELLEIIERCLSIDPKDRYANCQQVQTALEGASVGLTQEKPKSGFTRAVEWSTFAGLIALLALLGYWLWAQRQSNSALEDKASFGLAEIEKIEGQIGNRVRKTQVNNARKQWRELELRLALIRADVATKSVRPTMHRIRFAKLLASVPELIPAGISDSHDELLTKMLDQRLELVKRYGGFDRNSLFMWDEARRLSSFLKFEDRNNRYELVSDNWPKSYPWRNKLDFLCIDLWGRTQVQIKQAFNVHKKSVDDRIQAVRVLLEENNCKGYEKELYQHLLRVVDIQLRLREVGHHSLTQDLWLGIETDVFKTAERIWPELLRVYAGINPKSSRGRELKALAARLLEISTAIQIGLLNVPEIRTTRDRLAFLDKRTKLLASHGYDENDLITISAVKSFSPRPMTSFEAFRRLSSLYPESRTYQIALRADRLKVARINDALNVGHQHLIGQIVVDMISDLEGSWSLKNGSENWVYLYQTLLVLGQINSSELYKVRDIVDSQVAYMVSKLKSLPDEKTRESLLKRERDLGKSAILLIKCYLKKYNTVTLNSIIAKIGATQLDLAISTLASEVIEANVLPVEEVISNGDASLISMKRNVRDRVQKVRARTRKFRVQDRTLIPELYIIRYIAKFVGRFLELLEAIKAGQVRSNLRGVKPEVVVGAVDLLLEMNARNIREFEELYKANASRLWEEQKAAENYVNELKVRLNLK